MVPDTHLVVLNRGTVGGCLEKGSVINNKILENCNEGQAKKALTSSNTSITSGCGIWEDAAQCNGTSPNEF